MKLTARQTSALQFLNQLISQYPWTKTRGLDGKTIGRLNAAVLRKLEPLGLVIIHRPASNYYRYALTDAGRSLLGGAV